MADLLALFCVEFSCDFVTFSCGGLGHVWYLIVLTPDLCIPLYFVKVYTGICSQRVLALLFSENNNSSINIT